MAPLGQFALSLALVTTLYAIGASLVGIRLRSDRLIASGRNAGIATFAALTAAFGTLFYLFLASDFSVAYVVSTSNRDLPVFYKIAAIWGGQAGSLLLWGWILGMYSALVIVQNRARHTAMMPYVVAVMMGGVLFFTAMSLFVANPFHQLATVRADGSMVTFTAADGRGLNPLLQYFLNVIHPPVLYLGLVGFSVPFAFAMGAMLSRQLGDTWIRTTRRWTMVAWLFLGTGIMLGGMWAYVELGWGGYWAWDPVENASLMPWLLGTAFLHSVMIQEKKGMMKVWNMVLVILAYSAALFGTFLTRSGIVNSVHAFAQSNIGGYFLAFIIVSVASAFYLLYDRIGYLKTENHLESYASRESSFMFNNLLFVAACFAVLFGTMLPVISEAVTGVKMTVGPAWFNPVMIPIGLALLFVTGVGPLLAWRRSSAASIRKAFIIPAILAGVTGTGLVVLGMSHVYALAALTIAAFVVASIVQEFFKGTRARASSTGENLAAAAVNLTLRNTRRYGGYVVHFGMVLIFIGFAGQAFTLEIERNVSIGDTVLARQYTVRLDDIVAERTANFDSSRATISLFENEVLVARMYPERRFYPAGEGQATSEVAVWSNPVEDLYVNFAGLVENDEGSSYLAVLQVWLNPLVMWVWIGGIVIACGTLIALLPNKRTAPSRTSRHAGSAAEKSADRTDAPPETADAKRSPGESVESR
jgi:cytochrome c-type biogenesis protein CcmF